MLLYKQFAAFLLASAAPFLLTCLVLIHYKLYLQICRLLMLGYVSNKIPIWYIITWGWFSSLSCLLEIRDSFQVLGDGTFFSTYHFCNVCMLHATLRICFDCRFPCLTYVLLFPFFFFCYTLVKTIEISEINLAFT